MKVKPITLCFLLLLNSSQVTAHESKPQVNMGVVESIEEKEKAREQHELELQGKRIEYDDEKQKTDQDKYMEFLK